LWLAFNRAGATLTRHVIAVAQMLSSALLIHLCGGRLETHFHVFGSLAFLSFYRDWRVMVTGTVVVAADHFLRGLYWPESVYGLVTGAEWRWLEHAGWVAFLDVFLIYSCVRSRSEMWVIAERQARLEETNATIEQTVSERTAALQDRTNELQAACEQRNAVVQTALDAVVGMSADGRITDWNSQAERMFGYTAAEAVGRPMSHGIQWSVPGSRPRPASWGRAVRWVLSASERTMATATPCSMPTRATISRAMAASANSTRSNRKIFRSSPTRNSLVAMNTSVAASMASGRSASGAVATTATPRTRTAAMMLASWERVPDAVAMAVLGGLASTANAPISPATTLPAPTPIRSRLKSVGAAAPEARPADEARALDDEERTVAAVCAMHTNVTVSTRPGSRRSCDQET